MMKIISKRTGYSVVLGTMMILMVCSASLLLLACFRPHTAVKRISCANNLKQMGLVCKMFTNESRGGVFPAMQSDVGKPEIDLNFDMGSGPVYPVYLTDRKILYCPELPEYQTCLNNLPESGIDSMPSHHFYYLGYAVMNDEDLHAFAEAYRERIAAELPFDEDLETASGQVIYRLSKKVAQSIVETSNSVTDVSTVAASIPVMWDKKIHSIQRYDFVGANVLYLDGHVEFIEYPGKFPVTEEAVRIMAELDAMDLK